MVARSEGLGWVGRVPVVVVVVVMMEGFFLMRLPPRFEVPKMHSLPSFLHLPHGGAPPEASLGQKCQYMLVAIDVRELDGCRTSKWRWGIADDGYCVG